MGGAGPKFAITFLLGMVAGAILIWTKAYGPLFLSGPAEVIDGDSLRVEGVNVRLVGIETPELPPSNGKDCRTLLSRPGCMNRSAMAMRWRVGGKPVRCWITGRNALSAFGDWERPLGVCFHGDTELNAWLMRNCLAELPEKPEHRVWRYWRMTSARNCPREQAPVAQLAVN